MSMDLYADETAERMRDMRPVQVPDPGAFEGFARGAATAAMRTFASAGRALTMAAGGVASAVERVGASHPLSGGLDTSLSDSIFRFHDDTMQNAVDFWTPMPGEVGEAGQIVGQLAATLPLVIASPAATVAATQLGTAEDVMRRGVEPGRANLVGAVQGAGLGLGIWVPILGNNLWQRIALGGVGFNVAQGVATRAASGALLADTPAAEDFPAFDPAALTLDVLLGAAFGAIAHLSPAQRAQGAKFWADLEQRWGRTVKPSDVDALATLRQAQHLNVDSMLGRPVTDADIEAHVARLRTAIEQLATDQPVRVDDMPAARVEPDGRMAEAQARAEQLTQIAEEARQAEGLPPVPEGTEAPPAPRAADVAPPLGVDTEPAVASAMRTAEDIDAARATDPIAMAAEKIVADNPDLLIPVGVDEEGNVVRMTGREYLDDVRADVSAAIEDARLFEAAAVCLFSKG